METEPRPKQLRRLADRYRGRAIRLEGEADSLRDDTALGGGAAVAMATEREEDAARFHAMADQADELARRMEDYDE